MISSSPRSLPMDSGARRCQQASARATARPLVVRYMTIGRFAIVLDSRLRPTSWSHATAYQALSGKWRKAAWPVCAVGDCIGPDIVVLLGAGRHIRADAQTGGVGGSREPGRQLRRGCLSAPPSGGDRVLVVGGCFLDHEVEEEG